jgi:hypothetical protein
MAVTVIVVNYNAGPALPRMVDSLAPALGPDDELLVVDNASEDNSLDLISNHASNPVFIRNPDNRGFSAAVNQGMAAGRGDFFLLLNPDVVVQPGTLREMERFMAAHPGAGVAGGRVCETDGRLQLACRRGFPSPWVAFCRLSGLSFMFPQSTLFARYNLTFLDPDQEAEVDAVSGSFMMIRRAVTEQIGRFDEDFFLYAEDIDFCFRAKQAGWKVMYNPAAPITHAKGVCADSSPGPAAYQFYHTMWTFHKKHFYKKTLPPVNLLIWLGVQGMKFVKPRLAQFKAARRSK